MTIGDKIKNPDIPEYDTEQNLALPSVGAIKVQIVLPNMNELPGSPQGSGN